MTPQEIVNQVRKLSLSQQREVLQTLAHDLNEMPQTAERVPVELLREMLADGFISNLPSAVDDEDDFEPIEIEGEPLSETVIKERR
ncbi:MAG: hypothetical protein M3458_21350 [Acidobacteriota bacterium]|nr:hypothetical protein [Acidobacteriota bacterium]